MQSRSANVNFTFAKVCVVLLYLSIDAHPAAGALLKSSLPNAFLLTRATTSGCCRTLIVKSEF